MESNSSLMDQLRSLQPLQVVNTLNEILNSKTEIKISWGGERIISINGYSDSKLDEVTTLFLEFSRGDRTFRGRLAAYELWGRIQKLYHDSNEAVKNTYFIGSLTLVSDLVKLNYPENSMVQIKGIKRVAGVFERTLNQRLNEFDQLWSKTPPQEDPRERELFDYTPDEFKGIWPNTTPTQIINDGDDETWVASKALIEGKIQDYYPSEKKELTKEEM